MPEVAKLAFSSLALAAKLHRLLDGLGMERSLAQDFAFDVGLQRALDTLDAKHPVVREETKHLELELLKRDFDALEHLYQDYKEKAKLPEEAAQRFNRVFADISEKIKEKELTI